MRALILAAGRGSRLGALTAERPKGLVPLCGKSIIEWELDALRLAGIKNIAIVGGYRSEMLTFLGLPLFVNDRWSESNMVASLLCAAEWLSAEPCVVSYSDIVYSPSHVQALLQCPADLCLTYDANWQHLWFARFSDPLTDAETFQVNTAGIVTDIGRKPTALDEVQGQYMGLLKFTPQGFSTLFTNLRSRTKTQIDRLDMTSLLRWLMELGRPICAVRVSGKWGEIDSNKDLAVYESWSIDGKPFWML